ncbi:nicotinamide N-methyltransferase-like [Paramuricea clavata]|uniref:Nicotinamide N-methyltransferase-like n=1 Tax=Paramuricea clavata TaxID=317549 RepID=A0A6S7KCV7_PARCT|nr:nicotinamide N-methyltransferase-like [Paramuricea clavata]
MANLRNPEDYHSYFDPKTFLKKFYKNFKGDENEDRSVSPFIKIFHEFWSSFKAPADTELTDVRYREFGSGPSITNLVFACPNVDHIVFSEYTEANRGAVKSWIAGDPDAHDWMPLIEIDDVAKPFDVVSTSLCLEACVLSEVHYKKVVAELCKFLKPNGYLFMNGVLEGTFYFVGEEKFYNFPITEKMVKEAMIEAGIEIEKYVTIPMVPVHYTEVTDSKALFYTYGRKSAEK